jgi:hypothetical protein
VDQAVGEVGQGAGASHGEKAPDSNPATPKDEAGAAVVGARVM